MTPFGFSFSYIGSGLHFGFHLFGQLVGAGLGVGFAVDADDGFGITLAQVYPTVLKVYLHPVDGGYLASGSGVVFVGQPSTSMPAVRSMRFLEMI